VGDSVISMLHRRRFRPIQQLVRPVTKCYWPCADCTRLLTAYKWRVAWPLFC